MQWGSDSRKLVSASQDGKLIIWNAFHAIKHSIVSLRSSWVMTCAFSPNMKFVASGGLDNTCSVYPSEDPSGNFAPVNKPRFQLQYHDGYISCCRFIDDNTILTASGDQTCILWDLESQKNKQMFKGHDADVMSVAVCPNNNNLFISGSVDFTNKLWDSRVSKSLVFTFEGHESDVNTVAWHPDGQTFASGSDDSSVRVFDMRSYRQVQRCVEDTTITGVTSIDFSKNGRSIFAGYENTDLVTWDVLTSKSTSNMDYHEDRISSLGVSPDGKALATASFDGTLNIGA